MTVLRFCSLVWHLWVKANIYKPSLPFLFVWQYLVVLHFGSLNSVGTLPLWFKIINPGLITSNYIVKKICCILGTCSEDVFATVTRVLFWSSVNKWGIHLAFIFLSFRRFIKIPWTRTNGKFVIRANCLTVNWVSVFSKLRIFST